MYLVDTNVVSELFRPRPEPRVVQWLRALNRLTLSVVTVEEILFGLTVRASVRVERQFRAMLLEHIDVLPVDQRIAERSAAFRALARSRGRGLTFADALIAATAAEHRFAVASRNVRDFDGLGVRVFDPWST